MAQLAFITPEELQPVLQRLTTLELQLEAYIDSVDDDVDTKTALKLTGIKARATLLKVRTKELKQHGLITYRKEGTRSVYSRSSCIAYKLRHSIPSTLRVVK